MLFRFFWQFGGNPVSCSIANAVLDVIEKENLQTHAKDLGDYWLNQLKEIKDNYQLIGDIRYTVIVLTMVVTLLLY